MTTPAIPPSVLTAAGISAAGGALSGGIYNLTPPTLTKYRKARAAYLSGSARLKIACIGDSTTAGMGSNGSLFGSARIKSYPNYLAAALQAKDTRLITNLASRIGSQNVSDATYDPRLVLGSGWGNVIACPGGDTFTNNSTTNALAFSPGAAVDTVDVYYIVAGAGGSFTIDIGGATLATISQSGAAALGKTTVALGSLTTPTINAKRVSGTVWIIGFDAYNSAVPDVAIWNLGVSSKKVADLANATDPYGPLNGTKSMAPHLIILDIGINDWLAPTSLSAFAASYLTLATQYQTVADVIVKIPIPSIASSVSVATQLTYIAAMKSVATTLNLPVIDMTQRFVSQATADAAGYYFDTIHGNALNYADQADIIATVLTSI